MIQAISLTLCLISLALFIYSCLQVRAVQQQKQDQETKEHYQQQSLKKQIILLTQDIEYLKKLCVESTEEYNKIQRDLNEKQRNLDLVNYTIQEKQKDSQALTDIIKEKQDKKKQLDTEIIYDIEKKRSNLNKIYSDLEKNSLQAYSQYEINLDKAYQKKEEQYYKDIEDINTRRAEAQAELAQLKNTAQAAAAARLRELEDTNKKQFHCIQLTQNQMQDIEHLWGLKKDFHEPSVLSKLIWSSYILKPTSDLCNRVLKTSKPVTGIYKITNSLTKDVYIGQSVDIATRWKSHIKCGLGIDAPATNKLYQSMQVYCIWNFAFQLLQECSREKLNEKERYWIDFYQSNKVGLNTTKGNKT